MIDFLKGLLFPRKCFTCGAVLPDAKADTLFCSKCLLEYEKLERVFCEKCGKREKECVCIPETLRGKAEASLHLFAFDEALSHTLIYSLKQKNLTALQKFLAGRLSHMIAARFGEELSTFSITYAPRKPKSVRIYGFDQAKILAELIAKELSLPCEEMFVHARFSALQKTLNAKERAQNAEKSYSVISDFCPQTENLLIVDDVMTTGSTLSVLCELAHAVGYRKIIVVCVAKTAHRKKEERK